MNSSVKTADVQDMRSQCLWISNNNSNFGLKTSTYEESSGGILVIVCHMDTDREDLLLLGECWLAYSLLKASANNSVAMYSKLQSD